MNKGITSTPKSSVRSFTLLELIVVIVIIGILATLGYTQYSTIVEKGRLAEAKARIGLMRQLAYEYYLKNGSMDGFYDSVLGLVRTCSSEDYFYYWVWPEGVKVYLVGTRCSSGGKAPNAVRAYHYFMTYYPGSGRSDWYCRYLDDLSGCYGLPPFD